MAISHENSKIDYTNRCVKPTKKIRREFKLYIKHVKFK